MSDRATRIAEIRGRLGSDARFIARADIEWLLAEVERLGAARGCAECAEEAGLGGSGHSLCQSHAYQLGAAEERYETEKTLARIVGNNYEQDEQELVWGVWDLVSKKRTEPEPPGCPDYGPRRRPRKTPHQGHRLPIPRDGLVISTE